MPVSDASYMLRTGATDLTATENCTGVKAGARPYQEIKVRVYVPAIAAGADTLDIKFQQSDALGSGYADIPGAVVPQITGTGAAGTYEAVLPRWTKLYIRAVCTVAGASPNFGKVTIGFTPGAITTS